MRKDIIVADGTGSGKTTLGAQLAALKAWEIMTQDDPSRLVNVVVIIRCMGERAGCLERVGLD